MIRTLATPAQVLAVATQFVAQHATLDQSYRYLRQHKYMIKGRYYKYMDVLAHMQSLSANK